MHSIPMQRFAGRVSAFAAYGLPTLPRVTASRRTLFIVAIVLLIATLHALGILNAATIGLLAAGPIAEGEVSAQVRRLTELRDAEITAGEALTTKATSENRDLTTEELAEIDQHVKAADARDAQIKSVHDLEQRAARSAEERTRLAGALTVKVTRNESTYRPDGSTGSFFRDLIAARQGDWNAAERLKRNNAEGEEIEARAWAESEAKYGTREHRDGVQTGTTGMGAYIPPVWLVDQLAAKARVGRVLAPFMTDGGFPTTNSITIPRVTTGASVAGQAGDNAAVSETDQITALLTRTTVTIAGQQDVSLQSLDLSPYNVDQIIFADLDAGYEAELDRQILRGSGTNELLGINAVSSINTVTYTDASPTVPELYPKFADAIQQIHAARFMAPNLIIAAPRRWGWMLASLDTQNRPLIVPVAPVNAAAQFGDVASQGIVGSVQGVALATTGSCALTLGGGTEDQIVVARTTDMILMESPKRTRVLQEVLSGTLTVRLQLFAYVNFFAGRFPAGITTIGGTGLAAPTF